MITDFKLTQIDSTLLAEWKEYAQLSGLPLEYLILEAVTYTVRSDRLGIKMAQLKRQQQTERQFKIPKIKKEVLSQENISTSSEVVSPALQVISPVVSAAPLKATTLPPIDITDGLQILPVSTEYMDFDDSAALLDDHTPRDL